MRISRVVRFGNQCICSRPVYENCDFITAKEDGTSVAEDIFNRGLCLPSDIKNTRADMERIIKVVRGMFEK